MKADKHVSGFAAIAGRPNAGKSTLLNALVGEKVAIVASRPQTTRTHVQGVVTTPDAQIVFVDTPGIHRSDSYFNKRMMTAVREALDAPDVRLYIADSTRTPDVEEWQALDALKRAHTSLPKPSILVMNKIDVLDDKRLLLPRIEAYSQQHPFDEFIPVSALRGTGLDALKAAIRKYLPPGPALFPADYLTDQPERFLAAEMIREQILRMTHDEIPHSVAVKIENWEAKPKLVRISATITVERPGQKAIIIGAKGQSLKRIGTSARQQIETLTGTKVFLQLFVLVKENWRTNESFVNELDWRTVE